MYADWNITLPALTGGEERRAYVYVPDLALAEPERRYPVLYMFDGQNLFADADATFGKSWGLLRYITERSVPLIVAAIECNHHPETDECGGRLSEYSPFDFTDRYFGTIRGRGALTMDYYIREFKPFIDANYPTLPDRDHTFIGGSSMGGLMTLFALCRYGDVFSRGAALSPSLDFSPEEIRDMIGSSRLRRTCLYMDIGAKEMRAGRSRDSFAEVTALLIEKGVWVDSRVVPNGTHSEASWERQIPFFMDVLFYDLREA
ncbi:MAG: alpha/beta hydrolase [Oscillospiraceae bacterium]|nr:alpha/beta hydrolase [Oscillospiraceae bacterium]